MKKTLRHCALPSIEWAATEAVSSLPKQWPKQEKQETQGTFIPLKTQHALLLLHLYKKTSPSPKGADFPSAKRADPFISLIEKFAIFELFVIELKFILEVRKCRWADKMSGDEWWVNYIAFLCYLSTFLQPLFLFIFSSFYLKNFSEFTEEIISLTLENLSSG